LQPAKTGEAGPLRSREGEASDLCGEKVAAVWRPNLAQVRHF
jgi:hypothetical protein